MDYMQTMKMETRAVGCYLIDIPQGAEVSFAQGYRGAGADIEVFPCPLSQAEQLVRDRVEELRGTKHLEGGTLLERYVESKTLPHTWLLYRWEDRTFKSEDRQAFIDAYHWRQNTRSKDAQGKDAYLFVFGRGTRVNDDRMAEDQAKLEDLFRRVRLRDNREIPTEPGFCMEHSFMPDEAPAGHASISFTVPGHPDIFVRYENQLVSKATVAGEKLLDRMKRVDSDPMFLALTIDTLRAKERAVRGLQGQEYLKMIKGDGLWDMQFLWEYRGVGESWEKPAMSLELTNSRAKGSREPLSMTKEEAMALWDVLVDSIRPRPTTPPPQPRPPLGTRLQSGERCPQAGTWECAHGGALGGKTRTFRQGEEFPEAVLETRLGFFGRLLRRPAEVVVPTTWIWVGYPDGT